MDVDQEFAQGKNRPGELTSPDAAPPRLSEGLMNWPTITDEMMMENKTVTRPYTMVILKAGPNISTPGVEKIIWEHGRRNLSMRAAGLMSMIFPVADGGKIGVSAFSTQIPKKSSGSWPKTPPYRPVYSSSTSIPPAASRAMPSRSHRSRRQVMTSHSRAYLR